MGDLSAHFSRWEFACKCGCGLDTVDAKLLEMLEVVRQHFDAKVTITSGARCAVYNREIGGYPLSQHKLGRAADIVVEGVEPLRVQVYCGSIWPNQFGIGCYKRFTHLDSRNEKARWEEKDSDR